MQCNLMEYKATRRAPLMAPSCALLFPSCGVRVVVEAFPESPRTVPFRQFAPVRAVCKPPHSARLPHRPGKYHLSPTRNRHGISPVKVAIGNWIHGVEGVYRVLKLAPFTIGTKSCWLLIPAHEPLLAGGCLQGKRLRAEKRISRRSFNLSRLLSPVD